MGKLLNLQCFYGTCGSLDHTFKDIEIKINNISWENKNSLMIIMSENKILKNIQELKEQAEYKDKLLATVSHDLRTPLNGIIGMINLTMEEMTDKAMRK